MIPRTPPRGREPDCNFLSNSASAAVVQLATHRSHAPLPVAVMPRGVTHGVDDPGILNHPKDDAVGEACREHPSDLPGTIADGWEQGIVQDPVNAIPDGSREFRTES
jgi:hypothetical protein